MKKKVWIILGSVLVVGLIAAAYVWFAIINKPKRDIENAKADFQVNASDFIGEFETSDTSANRKYSGKVVLISGKVNSVLPGDSVSSVVFDEGKNLTVTVEFLPKYNEDAKKLAAGSDVKVQAEYMGYVFDPLLADFGERGDIKLKKGSLKK